MKKLLRASLTLSALSLVIFLFTFAQPANAATPQEEAYAKCTTGINNPCASFDVTVNPILIFQKAKHTADSPKDEAPSAMKDREGLCKQYFYGGSIWSGCVSGTNNMTFAGPGGVVPGGESPGTTVTTNEQGGTDVAITGSEGPGCGTDLGCHLMKLPGMLFAALGFLLLTLSSVILGIAGTVFNWVVIRTVFQFALYFGTSEGMLIAWGVLRDIANIGLLFTFIFVGFATILNTSSVEGYTAKKALPQLIIFAVLLNFSLFATQAVIDVANGFSSVFATYAGQEQCNQGVSSGSSGGQALGDCANLGISSKILEAAGMHQIFPTGEQAGNFFKQAAAAPYSYTVMLIMLSLMVTVTAMVLIAAAIMLIVRVVVLSLLMVTSPIGFAGMAIPALHKIAQDWWHKLINQAFFAPLFLLMIFVSLKLVEGLQSGEATIADAMLGNTGAGGQTAAGNMQVVMVFMIVIGFMIGALMIAQKMGAYGASFATKTAGNLTFGAHGFVARRTVGRVSGKVAEKIRGSNFGHTEAGRLFAGFADRGAKASFDVRGNKGLKIPGGVNIGDAQKGGYDKIVHDGQEAREKYAKSLKQTDSDKTEERRLNDLKDQEEAGKADSAARLKELQEAGNEQISTQEAANKVAGTARADARKIQEAKFTAALASGDAAVTAREQLALEQMTADHRTAVANEEAGIKVIRDQIKRAEKIHAQNIESAANKIAAYDKRIKGGKNKDGSVTIGVGDNAAKYRYAQNLHDTQNSLINRVSAGGRAGHHAYESIIRDAGKTKLQRALSAIEEEAGRGSGGAGSGPAATAHAPTTGTGPAPTVH